MFIDFAPSTIPPTRKWPSGLIAVVPFAMCGEEQYRFPEGSHKPTPKGSSFMSGIVAPRTNLNSRKTTRSLANTLSFTVATD